MTVGAARVAGILGGQATLGRSIRNLRQLRTMVEGGLPVESLDLVSRYVALNERDAAEIKYRIVAETTLARRTRLTLEESERLERLARIAALAKDVWEDEALAHEFLHGVQPQLGGERPSTDLGRDRAPPLSRGRIGRCAASIGSSKKKGEHKTRPQRDNLERRTITRPIADSR